ncbi:DUF1559 family PulG-like putative transporter [Gimesia aquarii]|uniref:DUF1559 domain-containing protein n=1 Tax=Gimesia aquarii TaxID=2527964 RepID=A0A517VYI0_9PLAN|nr:DUF1559 domain-containing protein [Gimesia aquarii]QDT98052.1 hypothetical protein V144x_35360 [Gimesia aquarii]
MKIYSKGIAVFLILLLIVLGAYYQFTKRPDYPTKWRSEGTQLGKLSQISMALDLYSQKYGTLPPAYTVDKEGNRLHSWRTLLLPYYGEPYKSLYEKIDLSKPWNSPENSKISTDIYYVGKDRWNPKGASHLAIVGPESAWNNLKFKNTENGGEKNNSFLLIVEIENSEIHWSEPQDLELDQIEESKTRKPLIKGVGIKFKNGRLIIEETYHFLDLKELKKQATFKKTILKPSQKNRLDREKNVPEQQNIEVL